jgi:NAD(P)-dependent dehydrogenase (short-subunit alcohol dehydrogenase family)
MRLNDKVAIVTGAGSGIGRATSALFAREGGLLMLNDIDGQSLDKVAAQIAKDKRRMVVGDIAKEETVRRLAEETMSAFGRIDVLVNNAGIHFLKDVTEMSVDEWDRLILVHLTCKEAGKAPEDTTTAENRERVRGQELRQLLQKTASAITAYGQESIPYSELSLRLEEDGEDLDSKTTRVTSENKLSALLISF